jgi:hypothetical protein
MRRFWTRERRFMRTTGPRPGAPEARTDFVSGLAGHVRETRRTVPSARLRFAFAGALTLLLLGSLAGFGGVGLAAAPFKVPIKVMKAQIWKTYHQHARARRAAYTPANDEYEGQCGRQRREHERALHAHQGQENTALSRHETTANHSNLTSQQRAAHYQQEQHALQSHHDQEEQHLQDEEDSCDHHGGGGGGNGGGNGGGGGGGNH